MIDTKKILAAIVCGLAMRKPGEVAKATGVHVNTVMAIRDGRNTNPTLETIQKLAKHLGI